MGDLCRFDIAAIELPITTMTGPQTAPLMRGLVWDGGDHMRPGDSCLRAAARVQAEVAYLDQQDGALCGIELADKWHHLRNQLIAYQIIDLVVQTAAATLQQIGD